METKKRLLISFKTTDNKNTSINKYYECLYLIYYIQYINTKNIQYNLLDVFYSHYIKIIQNLVYKNLNNGYILGKEKVVTLMYR